jgi:hypothetical protein
MRRQLELIRMSLKKTVPMIALAASVGIGALALSATTASAEVVCNAAGDCWRVNNHYDYQPTFGVTVYDDAWYRAHRHDRQYHWRAAHHERGYYRDGVWIRF